MTAARRSLRAVQQRRRDDNVQLYARWFYIARGWPDIWLTQRLREWSRTGIRRNEPASAATR